MDGEIIGSIGPYVSQVIWIIVIIVVLSIAVFLVPSILQRIFSKKRTCACGYNLEKNDVFCPKCGRRMGT